MCIEKNRSLHTNGKGGLKKGISCSSRGGGAIHLEKKKVPDRRVGGQKGPSIRGATSFTRDQKGGLLMEQNLKRSRVKSVLRETACLLKKEG